LPLHPSPLDWRNEFIYFLLVDRLDDNAANPQAYAPGQTPSRNDRQEHRFHGGNLKGITRRLDYTRNLGCSTLWLSPILKNRQDLDGSYHGYGIQDFLQVNPR
jgi:glycosidase